MRYLIMSVFALWGLAGVAQGADLPLALDELGDRIAEAVAPDTLSKLEDDPQAFAKEVAELILGYGRDGSIGAQGIENFIALDRAYWRARELRRFLLADLDGDGDITAKEMSVLAATQSARQRGKSVLSFRAADRDGDGVLSWGEQRANADALALRKLPESEAELLRGLLALDLDRDGRLSLEDLDALLTGVSLSR